MRELALTGAPVATPTLLRGIVDYAGLFPPASRDMPGAVAEYAMHRQGDAASLLGRFVLPAARLTEFEDAAAALLPRASADSWPLAALLGSDVEQDIDRIEAFNRRHADVRTGAVSVDTVELKVYSPREVARAAELLGGRFDRYMEVPVSDDPTEMISAIAGEGARAKVRTGGVTADAFPSGEHVVRFIARCVARSVVFKATAGLHHALRGDYPLTYAPQAATAPMFGFLNVLLTTVAVRAGLPAAECAALLEERDVGAVRIQTDGIRWRGRHFDAAAVAGGRDSMRSFGACSFAEPVQELRALHLL